MAFIQFAIRNPVKVTVGVILAVLFGLLSFFATPVRLTPNVDEPEITVTTLWPGASAQEIEREIIDEQEEQLKSVEGLREFKSVSSDSRGQITLEFEVGTDLGEAAAKVRDKLNQVPEYPEDAKEPVITTVNPNANAIAWFILKPITPTVADLKAFVALHPDMQPVLEPMISGKRPVKLFVLAKLAKTYPKLRMLVDGKNDPTKMKKFAEDYIEARFERINGIANANVLGGREEEFRIVVDPPRLAAFGLTIADLRRALRAENKNTSGGDIREGKNRNVIRTIGQFDSPEKVAETIVTYRDNTPIRVKDVAQVGIDYKKLEGVVRQTGINALAVNAQQASGTNLIQIMGPPLDDLDLNRDGELTQLELSQAKKLYGDSLRIAAAELNIGELKQRGLYLEQVYDQTDYLNSATDLVKNNIYIGGTLAVLVLLLFLRSIRSVAIIAVSIPISVIATFLFVRGFGRSINVISLAGMAFAVGMVVDNAIVVLENIFRHYQSGKDAETSASKGAMEVWGAVLASTLTTLAVFIPVIFVEGQAGQLFRDIAIAISCAVGLSLIVSITVIPTAARRILSRRFDGLSSTGDGSSPERKSWGMFGLASLGTKLNNRFAGFIDKLQTMPGNVLIRIGIVVLFITASIAGTLMLQRKTEYLPQGNRNLVIAFLIPPPGYNVETLIDLGKDIIEPELAPYWEAEPGSPEEAALNGPRIDNFFFVARGQRLFMGARSVDPLRAGELVPVMQQAASKVPGMFAIASQASLFERSITGGRTIDIEITGPDLETLVTEGRKVLRLCMENFPPVDPETGQPTGHQIQPLQSLELSSPELHVIPRREKAAELGINASDLGYAIDALVDGAYAGDYWYNGNKIDLVIYGADEYSRHTHDLENLPISTPSGKLVTVSSVAEVKLVGGPDQVAHSERVRSITLQLRPGPTMPLERAMEIVNENIREPMLQSPSFEGGLYQIQLAGTADKLEETRLALQWRLVLALLITYLLMAALFESFFYPLIIMASVILAMVGGFGGLAVLNLFTPQSLDMLTMLGFVILIGTVVNSAILIVHQSLNNMRYEGMSDRQAIVESVRTRIRPIFMSTLTTVLGMLPLILPVPSFTSEGMKWVAGAGSELYRGLGSVVLGGMVVSTVFTLILVPVSFSLALDLKKKLAGLFGLAPNPVALAASGSSDVDMNFYKVDSAESPVTGNGEEQPAPQQTEPMTSQEQG